MDPAAANTIQLLHNENNRLRARVNALAAASTQASGILEVDSTQEEL